VSYFRVSAEMVTLASAEVMKESFRQEKSNSNKDMVKMLIVFIAIKNKLRV
jgi:hypothetical protein